MPTGTNPDALRSIIVDFLNDFHGHVGTSRLDTILNGNDTLTEHDVSSRPESWIEDTLIWELIDEVGLNRQPGRPSRRRKAPDFRLEERDGDIEVIGENKSLNKIDQAEDELVDDYLSQKAWPDYGIATDGIDWVVYRTEHGGDFPEFNIAEKVELRPVIREIALEEGFSGVGSAEDIEVEEELQAFIDVFASENLSQLLIQEAPKEFRDTRQRNVEAFYQLYIELLFGESSKHDYKTCLLDDIESPVEATEQDERLFAVTLMNRLLFIKFLETRSILPDKFLQSRVEHYQEHSDVLAGNLYESQIRPLFYRLLNTPEEDREPKYQSGWFIDVPYLNGGLFRENLPHESRYAVKDRTLPTIVSDLIEKSNLELETNGHSNEDNGGSDDNDEIGESTAKSFDPSLLGSVFEMTINHISSETGTQKDIGAYYTPSDVTRIITEDTVDPKLKEILVESFMDAVGDDDRELVRRSMESDSLPDMLYSIENAEGLYGAHPDALKTARNRIYDLKILDPACGSGHFLTSVMEEVQQVLVSILRGLNGGDDPSPEERYHAKKKLALNAIYGVDVDRIGVEIAKLRVWLKIVEGQDWEPSFGKLPNIDVNIVAGNSIIGFPVKNVQQSLDAGDERLDKLRELRNQYKYEDDDEVSRLEITDLESAVRGERDEKYLGHLNYTVTTEIDDNEDFWDVIDAVPEGDLDPAVESIKIERADGEDFGVDDPDDIDEINDEEGEKEKLRDIGFSVHTQSARLDIGSALDTTYAKTEKEKKLIGELEDLLKDEYVVVEVVRQPLAYDLAFITGEPFHWDIEFLEVLDEETGSVSFDVIVGNPPYGDLLGPNEEIFVDPYETGDIPDISAQFVERQLQILDDDGYYGNITTLRLVYQSSIAEFHALLRKQLETTRVSSFGTRPSRVFENADIKTAIFTGAKDVTDDEAGSIVTSDLKLFTQDNRREAFASLEHSNTDGYVLRDKIGGSEGWRALLPKIGPEEKKDILQKLKVMSHEDLPDGGEDGSEGDSDGAEGDASGEVGSDDEDADEENGDGGDVRLLSDIYERGDGASGPAVWRREGVRYWINAMREELYSAREVKPMYFDNELKRDATFLIMNSSLFYCYWLTYGNSHHLNWTQIEAFPYPKEDVIDANKERIDDLADELWEGMADCFDPTAGVTGEFDMAQNKALVDEVDELVGEMYELSDEETEYLRNYPPNFGGNYGRVGPTTDEASDQSELETESAAGD